MSSKRQPSLDECIDLTEPDSTTASQQVYSFEDDGCEFLYVLDSDEMDAEDSGNITLIRQRSTSAHSHPFCPKTKRFIAKKQKRGIEHMPSQQIRIQRENQIGRTVHFPSSNIRFANSGTSQSRRMGGINVGQYNNSQRGGNRAADNISRNRRFQSRQPRLETFAEMLSRIGQASEEERDNFDAVIGNLMQNHQQRFAPDSNQQNIDQMGSNELLSHAARILLNHIAVVQRNFGPKYDMQMQQEIHTLQRKTIMYRSLGVVSSDGPGIGNLKVKPARTNMSMNMRFS